MKNFYDITTGQFITVLLFGFIAWVLSLKPLEEGSNIALFFVVGIPFALVFYTIGWRNHKNLNG